MTNENSLKSDSDVSSVIHEIKSVMDTARNNVANRVNTELLNAYWNIGRIICEYEQTLPDRADYGKQTLDTLSKELTKELGKGFSRANLYNMRQLYTTYKIFQSVTGKLTWKRLIAALGHIRFAVKEIPRSTVCECSHLLNPAGRSPSPPWGRMPAALRQRGVGWRGYPSAQIQGADSGFRRT